MYKNKEDNMNDTIEKENVSEELGEYTYQTTDNEFPVLSIIFYILSGFFVILGFYKILIYENGEYTYDSVNAYVGGDAYNYIINANYATAYFVLALLFSLIASTIWITNKLDRKKI